MHLAFSERNADQIDERLANVVAAVGSTVVSQHLVPPSERCARWPQGAAGRTRLSCMVFALLYCSAWFAADSCAAYHANSRECRVLHLHRFLASRSGMLGCLFGSLQLYHVNMVLSCLYSRFSLAVFHQHRQPQGDWSVRVAYCGHRHCSQRQGRHQPSAGDLRHPHWRSYGSC